MPRFDGSGGGVEVSGDYVVPAPLVIQPVFVVGMNGSGTTMLVESLSRHPSIFGFMQETRLLPHIVREIRSLGDLNVEENFMSAWEKVLNIPAFAVANGGSRPPLPRNWRELPRDVAAIIDAVFRFFASKHDKVRWCDKSPQNVQHLALLGEVFPEARFVHVIRDGRACAASFNRRWGRKPELTIYRWKNVVAEGRRQGSLLGRRYMEVRYEDLTATPEYWMKGICSFLDVDYDPRVLLSREPQSEAPNSSGRIRRKPEIWRERFADSTVRRLEGISGAYLAEMGYETKFHTGSKAPAEWQLCLWRGRDFVLQYGYLIKAKIQGKRRISWKQVLMQPFNALKQLRENKY